VNVFDTANTPDATSSAPVKRELRISPKLENL